MANAKSIRSLRTLIEIGLTGTLAVMIGNMVWSLAARPGSPSPGAAIVGTQVHFDVAGDDLGKYNILTTFNPFASKGDQQAVVNRATLDAPETSLNLVLKGSRAAGEQLGIAVIQLPDNRQIRAEVGDEILDGVVLEYIFANRVTLSQGGRLENLLMRDGEASVILPAGSRAVERTARTSERRPTRATPTVSVTQFWKTVQLQTVRENGTRNGYRVLPRGDDSEALAAAGFQINDIIRAVNSTPISKLDSEDLQELMSANRPVQFDVERGGLSVQVQTTFRRGDKR